MTRFADELFDDKPPTRGRQLDLEEQVEGLGPEAYDKMSYYERWMASICQTLLPRVSSRSDGLAGRCPTGWDPCPGVAPQRSETRFAGRAAGAQEPFRWAAT